jgi:hypothetical protein
MASTSPVVETVSRKRVVPAEELVRERTGSSPDFWEYVESLKPDQWSDHIVYLYRQEPKTTTWPGAPPAYLDKYVGTIDVRPGYTVAMDDAGTIQQAIKEKFGGRVFRLICKKGRERICETTFSTEAAPRYPDTTAQYAVPPNNPLPSAGQSDANALASKAIDTVANQPQEMMNIAINALRASAEMIARSATTPSTTPTMDSDLDRAFKQAMIQKLLAPAPPPPDPFEMFVKFKQVIGDGNGMSSNASTLVEKVLGAAVDKILNPLPAVSGRTTLLDLGREVLPAVIHAAKDTMHEYRLSVEAQAHIAEINRGMVVQRPHAESAAPQMPAAIVAPQPTAAAANPPEATPELPPGALTFPQIETHIAKIIKNTEYPVDEAVERVLEFLYDSDPRIVAALLNPPSIHPMLKPGKEGLLQLFSAEPSLQPCTQNLPRLSEFLDRFIIVATEAEATEARLRAAAPANAETSKPV